MGRDSLVSEPPRPGKHALEGKEATLPQEAVSAALESALAPTVRMSIRREACSKAKEGKRGVARRTHFVHTRARR